jgi:hypothetical protein
MALTLDVVTTSKPRLRPYRLSDGSCLFLEVSPAGGKYWRFKYRFQGKANTISCGVFPAVSIDDARKRRDVFRAMLSDGINPSEHAKAGRANQVVKAKQLAAVRFALDSDGALSFRLASRRLTLTPSETAELRFFLDATRAVTPKVTPCL